MANIPTYCQLSNLQLFFDSMMDYSLDSSVRAGIEKLFFQNSILHIESCDRVIELSSINPFFKKLINAHTDGLGVDVIEDPETLQELIHNEESVNGCETNALHIHAGHATLEKGQFKVDAEKWIAQINSISEYHSYVVTPDKEKRNFPGWSIFRQFGLPLNSAVICDQYLLQQFRRFHNNLFRLLKELLPENLVHFDFHLSIFTGKDLVNPEKKLKDIERFIASLNLAYQVHVSLYLVAKNDLHDRYIFTNYYWLKSGHSLNYFNDKGQISVKTTLDFFPINNQKNDPYFKILKLFSEIAERAKADFDFFGNFQNRLLKMI